MEDESKSLFNSGIAKLKRIDRIRTACFQVRLASDYNSWKVCLESWRSELNYKMNENEKAKCNQYEGNISKIIGKSDTTIIYSQLKLYELLLGDIECKYGLGMPDTDNPIDVSNRI